MFPLPHSPAALGRYAIGAAIVSIPFFGDVLAGVPAGVAMATPAAENVLLVPAALDVPVLNIRRDPFSAPATATPVSGLPGDPSAGMVLPPNAAAGAPVLRAIVAGPQPKALIDVGGRPSVVGIGSPLAGSTVAAIGKTVVVLDDGRTLHLTEERP